MKNPNPKWSEELDAVAREPEPVTRGQALEKWKARWVEVAEGTSEVPEDLARDKPSGFESREATLFAGEIAKATVVGDPAKGDWPGIAYIRPIGAHSGTGSPTVLVSAVRVFLLRATPKD